MINLRIKKLFSFLEDMTWKTIVRKLMTFNIVKMVLILMRLITLILIMKSYSERKQKHYNTIKIKNILEIML